MTKLDLTLEPPRVIEINTDTEITGLNDFIQRGGEVKVTGIVFRDEKTQTVLVYSRESPN